MLFGSSRRHANSQNLSKRSKLNPAEQKVSRGHSNVPPMLCAKT
jgi:hypothetical protein